jgi:hypothetical protein
MVDLNFLISKFVYNDRELSHVEVVSEFLSSIRLVRYHCGGRSEEVNSCVLNSYMVYL